MASQLHERRSAWVSAKSRDPRAAVTRLAGTVAVSESCGYYGVADAVSRCRVPRSCQDCLAMPGCGLTDTGSCMNVKSDAEWFADKLDYRIANFSVDSLVSQTSAFVFTADNASYCSASDPVCTKCREQFQANDANRSSAERTATQFCLGADGCVCIAICEVPRRRASRVVDWQCGQPGVNADPFPAISRSRVTSVRGDPRRPIIKVQQPLKDKESCEYINEVDIRGCRRPRTCQSCLNKPGCEIVDGRCSARTPDSWSRDFRNTYLDGNNMGMASSRVFPSSNTTLCPASDATCTACRSRSFRKGNVYDWFFTTYNSFCVGQDGCVCIEVCESEVWATLADDPACNRLRSINKYPINPVGLLFGIAVASLLLLGLFRCCSRMRTLRHQERQRDHPWQEQNLWRNMLDEVPALPLLDLFGWRAFRQELHNREREVLRGGDISGPLRHPVDFVCMNPSAPDFDEDESSAPTAQDPKALASAPVYRNSHHDRGSISDGTSSSTDGTDHSSPSAPDFEIEDVEWESIGCEGERIGLVTRRPWRGE